MLDRMLDYITPGRIRTCDNRFRKPVLYPLSYGGDRPPVGCLQFTLCDAPDK